MIISDTNVLSYLLLGGPKLKDCEELSRFDGEWAVPLLWRSEFNSLVGQHVRAGLMEWKAGVDVFHQAENRVGDLEKDVLPNDVYQVMSEQEKVSAYDAEFVALARVLGVKLATFDGKLLQWFPDVAMKPLEIVNLKEE